ncbi:T9SS type A sorting domain-containing protein [Flavobacterium alvei]|uniref:T9SS type A sorting domain-containing protein n=1 Tax=Flavobacterium alvei TaxID=2080416 RepID=UPI0026F08300|nr:T9SS type A sorting domain-containing protein [Flavobacterium alvei]
MKTKLLSLAVLVTALLFSANTFAQTTGSMTYTFTTVKIGSYTKQVMGVWVENATGTFVKTRLLYTTSTKTDDHFPILSAKNGATEASTADTAGMDVTSGNNVGAISGATRSATTSPVAWGAYSVSWDGTNSSSVAVPDGVYKVWVELTADGNASSDTHDFINTGYSFTKGASVYDTNISAPIANNTVLTSNRIVWTPSALSIDSVYKTKIAIYPNPSNGVFNVQYNDIPVSKIDVVNVLGQVVKSIKLDVSPSKTLESIDMNGNANGLYIINVSTNETSSSYKVILDK